MDSAITPKVFDLSHNSPPDGNYIWKNRLSSSWKVPYNCTTCSQSLSFIKQCFSMNTSAYFLILCTLAFSTCLIAYTFPSFFETVWKIYEKLPDPICLSLPKASNPSSFLFFLVLVPWVFVESATFVESYLHIFLWSGQFFFWQSWPQ